MQQTHASVTSCYFPLQVGLGDVAVHWMQRSSPDIRFTVSGIAPARPFDVYTKIIDTVAGNSSTSGITLEGQGAAESQTGMITAQHFPYMYRMEVQSERQNDATEKANFTVLYAY